MSKLKKFSIPKLNVTQASVTSAFVYIVGQAVTFVPGIGPEKVQLISVGSMVIAGVFALVHAIHAVVDLVAQYIAGNQKVTLSDLEGGVRSLAQEEIGKVNLTSDVEKVLATKKLPSIADVEAAAEKKVQELLANLKLSVGGQPVQAHTGDAPAPVLADPAVAPEQPHAPVQA